MTKKIELTYTFEDNNKILTDTLYGTATKIGTKNNFSFYNIDIKPHNNSKLIINICGKTAKLSGVSLNKKIYHCQMNKICCNKYSGIAIESGTVNTVALTLKFL